MALLMCRELQLKIKSLEGAPRSRNEGEAHDDSEEVRRLQKENADLARNHERAYEQIQKILTATLPQQSHASSKRGLATSLQAPAVGAGTVTEAEVDAMEAEIRQLCEPAARP
jgi:hypothetical protein